jgi:hypothetical protein
MKLQLLGDSKDSFKWDYHDWLASELQVARLTVALMLTPDDGTGDGRTKADDFPARTSVLRFCRELQSRRDIERIKQLPACTGASYDLALHKGAERPLVRRDYFSGFDAGRDQIVFIDPDNGFEPEKSCEERHISYGDVAHVLAQLNENSVVSVFHHFRRVSFLDDFARIRARLGDCRSTAIYWDPRVMFVAVANSERMIAAVAEANIKYVRNKRVKVIR